MTYKELRDFTGRQRSKVGFPHVGNKKDEVPIARQTPAQQFECIWTHLSLRPSVRLSTSPYLTTYSWKRMWAVLNPTPPPEQ